jgi:hypothetical protein
VESSIYRALCAHYLLMINGHLATVAITTVTMPSQPANLDSIIIQRLDDAGGRFIDSMTLAVGLSNDRPTRS